jgi:hypothetical protein
LSAQQVIQDIERGQLKDDAGEQELIEIDGNGQDVILLVSWRRTRFEVVQVLREVLAPPSSSCLSSHG